MTRPGWEGFDSLLLLARWRLRAKVMAFLRACKRPKQLAVLVLVGLVVALVFAGQSRQDSPLAGDTFVSLYPLFLTFLLLTTMLTSVAHGVMSFTPPEVQFLFPAPIGSRALMAMHLLESGGKSLTGALVFACFLRPGGIGFLRAATAYGLLFMLLLLLGLALDLAHIELAPAVRKRRSRVLGVCLAVLIVGSVSFAAWIDGGWSLTALRPLSLPVWPVTQMLFADRSGAWQGLALITALIALLGVPPLTFRGNVREAAGRVSERVQKALQRMRSGPLTLDNPGKVSTGWKVPMLPHWGGAGVHAWRQLTALARLRKSYVALLAMAVLVAVSVGVTAAGRAGPSAVAGAVLGMLVFAGPAYVQCDFRADYDSLAYLRSLPSTPTALAAGQLLASTLVLWVLQLVAGSWIVVVVPPSQSLLWLALFALLPFVNLIQLAVENGVFLLFPWRAVTRHGPPGALAMGRLYALLMLKLLVVMLLLGVATLAGFLVGAVAGPVAGGLAGMVVLVVESGLCVWLVGRLFLRVDVSRDLAQ